MSKHTPGPWNHVRGQIFGDVNTRVCRGIDMGNDLAASLRGEPLPDDVIAANAALISAAPDLLAALVEVDTYLHGVQALHHDDVTEAVRATVLAAIAKATGGAA